MLAARSGTEPHLSGVARASTLPPLSGTTRGRPAAARVGTVSTEFDWQWSAFDALTPAALYAVLEARAAVFVVEQACAYQDLDGYDARADHLVAWQAGTVAAYCRVFAPGVKYAEGSVGRVLTALPFRRTGVGRELVARALAQLDALHPGRGQRISAQQYLERFYASFGFATVSAPYPEDGIPHVEMLRAGRAA
jgi:ElaA protein